MYTNRRTFIIKRGKMFEAIELIKAGPYPPIRVYGPDTIAAGPFDALIAEWEYESLAAYESAMVEHRESDEMADLQARIFELTEIGGTNEILRQY